MTPQPPTTPAGVHTPVAPAGIPIDRHGAHEVSRWIESLFLRTRERT